ncbi:MAG: hypothetical protein WCS28_09245 [Thiomicrospira sp.]
MLFNFYPLEVKSKEGVMFDHQTISEHNTDGTITLVLTQSIKIKTMTQEIFVESAKSHVLKILENPADSNRLQSFLEDKLKNLESYKTAYSKTPPMRSVPAINLYRNNPKKYTRNFESYMVIENEIKNHGVLFEDGQIVFHGGDWPSKNPKIGEVIELDRVFSTSLDPHVARVHSLYPPNESKCIWHITLKNMNQPAFVFHPKRGKLKHEFEILLVSGLFARLSGIFSNENGMLIDVVISDSSLSENEI